MTNGVNPTGVNKISVHSMNTFMNLPHQFPKHNWLFSKMFLPFILKLNLHRFTYRVIGTLPISIQLEKFPSEFPARFSNKIFPQYFPARFSRNIFPQDFPTRFSTTFPAEMLCLNPTCLNKIFLDLACVNLASIDKFTHTRSSKV